MNKKRLIKQIVIHCTATKEGNHITFDMVRSWHIAKGFSDIGYHYLILLDGTVIKGREEWEIGAGVKNYNNNTLHICYVGGLNDNMQPKDTRTDAQRSSLRVLIASLKTVYRDAYVCGHRDFPNVIKACPCFNASIIYADFNGSMLNSPFRL